jgi:hypothetical protein
VKRHRGAEAAADLLKLPGVVDSIVHPSKESLRFLDPIARSNPVLRLALRLEASCGESLTFATKDGAQMTPFSYAVMEK